MTETLPILYSFRRCPYAMRARMALKVSGQAVELREVVLRNKPEAMIEASPKATVPVMMLPDSNVLEESLDIMLWALERNDPDHWFVPTHGSRDEMLALIEEIDGPFKTHLDRYKYDTRLEEATPELDRAAAFKILAELAKRLETHPYLFGERLSLGDAAVFPFVRQFANVNRVNFEASAPKPIVDWLDRCLGTDLFGSVMEKYAPWVPGEPGISFP